MSEERARQIFPRIRKKVEERLERLAPPPEIVSLEDINIRLKRLLDAFQSFITLQEKSHTRLGKLERGLSSVEQAIRETMPEGVLVPRTVEVVESKTVDLRGEPWFSFSVYNDGPDAVHIGVNTYPEEEVPINKREHYDCPFEKRGSIRTIYLVCGKDKSASVRIYGVR